MSLARNTLLATTETRDKEVVVQPQAKNSHFSVYRFYSGSQEERDRLIVTEINDFYFLTNFVHFGLLPWPARC